MPKDPETKLANNNSFNKDTIRNWAKYFEFITSTPQPGPYNKKAMSQATNAKIETYHIKEFINPINYVRKLEIHATDSSH